MDVRTRNFSIALREVQVSNAEFGALDVHWQVHFAASRKVFDVTIPSMLWTSWNGSCSLLSNLLEQIRIGCGGVHALWRWWNSNISVHMRASLDQFPFSLVPNIQNLLGWRATENTRMNEASESDSGDMARATEDALEVPNSFGSA
jgi:hypothetical protein